jgi:hypothetical protein
VLCAPEKFPFPSKVRFPTCTKGTKSPIFGALVLPADPSAWPSHPYVAFKTLFGFVQVPLAWGASATNKKTTATSVQITDGFM